MILRINTDGLVALTNKLEKLHRSALPSAVRGTLNDAVYDVKTNTMMRSASQEFINRDKNFFKANSKFDPATGFDIKTMEASVGFKSIGGKNYAVEDLEQQESGGEINKKSFIPTVFARKGGTKKGLVKPNARLSSIKKIINVRDSVGKNSQEKFVIAAAVAGKGGFVLKGNMLYRITTAPKSNLKTRKANFKAEPIYSFKEGRKANVNATHFMEKATLLTAKKLPDLYYKQGERQLTKVWK